MQTKPYKTVKALMVSLISVSILFSVNGHPDGAMLDLLQVDAGDDQQICIGESTQLMATGATSFTWIPSSGLSCTQCPDPIASPLFTTTYYVLGSDNTIDSVKITVLPFPEILMVESNDPTSCIVDNGTISITAQGSSTLEYSVNGGSSWQAESNFTALPEGSYLIMIRNVGGACQVVGPSVNLQSPDKPIISNVVLNQPSGCDLLDGSITIISSGGVLPVEYSIDGGNNWQPSPNFDQLASGYYNLIVRNTDLSCQANGGIYELSASTEEADIDGMTVINPSNCNTSDGSIEIIVSNNQNNFEYSIDGGSIFQPNPMFQGLIEGIYDIKVRKTDGTCTVTGGLIELTSPARPSIDGYSFLDPSFCGAENGIITILATGGIDVEYSINSGLAWQSSNQFVGLSTGSYQTYIRNADGSCLTAGQIIQLEEPDGPEIDNVFITHPSGCGINNGVITIVASGGLSLRYSIDNGSTWSNTPTFTGLLAGSYQVSVAIMGQFCPVQSLAILENPSSCIDTIDVNILENTVTEICLDNDVLESNEDITSTSICQAGNPTDVTISAVSTECITLEPAPDFFGQASEVLCVIHCYNNSSTQCDTTYLQVTVEEVITCDVFSVDTLEVDYVGNPTHYCVPVPLTDLAGFELTFQGVPVNSPVICNPDQSFAYSYGALIGGGFDGPYTITAWNVGGASFSGNFNDPFELVALMNAIDPSGFWQINTQGSIIYGGNPNLQYGNMNVLHENSGIPAVLVANFSPQAQGFQIELENPNEHLLVATDTLTGCSDTLVINAVFEIPQPETVYLSTTVNVPTSSFCLNGAELPSGSVQSIGFCGDAQFGNVSISNDSCVVYLPNIDFAGQDSFCLIICENSFPQICDTTFFIVDVLPEMDTVFLEIFPNETSVDSCLSSSAIELPGPIDQVFFCEIDNGELDGSINSNCVEFSPVAGFTGTSEACAVFCSNGFCDTTIVIVTVYPPVICDEIIQEEAITVISPVDFTDYCLPILLNEIINFDVTLDGQPFSGFAGCDYQDVVLYNYGAWNGDPFSLNLWTVNANAFTGDFLNIAELVDSMNVWDPSGNWNIDLATTTIRGGDDANNYGNIVLSIPMSGVLNISPDLVNLPLGSNLFITGFGNHEIIVGGPDGCSDTLSFSLQQHVTSTDTLYFNTDLNTLLDPICVTTNELLGVVADIDLCSAPQNGSVTITSDTCVSYLPNSNFLGPDGFCIVICDDNLPEVCDTFQIVISVNGQLPTDTIFIQTNETEPFDTCLTSQFLQIPSAVDTAWICGNNANEVDLTVVGECLTIDAADDFTGTTVACVVHCTDDVPPICDTTIIVLNMDTSVPCEDVFDPDHVVVVLENNTGEICLPVPISEIALYDVMLDGSTYQNGFSGCDIDTVFEYPILPSFEQGSQSPYAITWLLNGILMSGTVNNAAELTALMNGWDPAGNWVLNTNNFRIVSSNQTGDYGQLTITNAVGFTENIDPILGQNPLGTLVNFMGEGQHELVLIDPATGCDDTLFINAVDPNNVIQITTFENTPSQQLCLDTLGLPGDFTAMTICESPVFGSITIAGNCLIYTPNPGYVGNDEACLEICDDLGNCQSWIVQIAVLPFCSQFDFFTNDVQSLQAPDCADLTTVCLPIEFDSLANFGLLDNGVPVSNFNLCNGIFAEISLDTGFHELILVHLMSQCMDTLYLDITCQQDNGCGFAAISDLNLSTIECDDPLEFCVEVPFTDLGNFLVTDNGVVPAQVGACSVDPQFVGVQLDTGLHVLVFADTVKGCADTFLVNIECFVCPDFFPNDEIFAATSCENSSAFVCLPYQGDELSDLIFDLNGNLVNDQLIPCGFDSSFMMVYSDLPNQGLVGPYEILDFTINGAAFTGLFNNVDELLDSLNTWDSNANWSSDIVPPGDIVVFGGTGGNVYSDIIVQQQVTGITDTLTINVELSPNRYGLELPIGMSTLTVTDTIIGCSESVIADIVCVSTEVVFDTVQLNTSGNYQIDLSELMGNVVSVENICEDASGENVSFEITNNQVDYTGISIGTDTACIVACDDLGICDTTILIVTVIPNDSDTTIIANDDDIITGEGQVTLIDVLQNDQFTGLTDFYIVVPPANGQAAFLPNGSVNYVPDSGYCDDDIPDSFEYAICNGFGCDTATVTVLVTCESLQVFNAFSPNSDNRNDFFKIKGLQNYPDHIVQVYNRWGNLVFEATQYQNNWDGVWEGRNLPDGTYFYLIDLGNDEKPLSGYVQIRR